MMGTSEKIIGFTPTGVRVEFSQARAEELYRDVQMLRIEGHRLFGPALTFEYPEGMDTQLHFAGGGRNEIEEMEAHAKALGEAVLLKVGKLFSLYSPENEMWTVFFDPEKRIVAHGFDVVFTGGSRATYTPTLDLRFNDTSGVVQQQLEYIREKTGLTFPLRFSGFMLQAGSPIPPQISAA